MSLKPQTFLSQPEGGDEAMPSQESGTLGDDEPDYQPGGESLGDEPLPASVTRLSDEAQ